MDKKNYLLFVLLTFALLLPHALLSSELPNLEMELVSIDIKAFPLVELLFSVVDPNGRAVVHLEERNFSLRENLRDAAIVDMSMDETPLNVVLLLDRSGSMYDALSPLKRGAGKFVQLLEPRDRVMLIDFSNEPKILCPFTRDEKKLRACLQTLHAWGPTALYDSLYRSILEVAPVGGRKVILALTDGTDQNEERTAHLSRHTLKEVIERAKRERVPIFTIGLGRFVSKKELQAVAKHSGGRAYFAPSARELEELYIGLAKNLKSRVRLVYKSPEKRRDGQWRQIMLRCSLSGVSIAEAKEKYRAPGRFVLETEGQGWKKLKEDELSLALPRVVLRNHRLKQIKEGKPEDVKVWLENFYWRGEGERRPPRKENGGSGAAGSGAAGSGAAAAAGSEGEEPLEIPMEIEESSESLDIDEM